MFEIIVVNQCWDYNWKSRLKIISVNICEFIIVNICEHIVVNIFEHVIRNNCLTVAIIIIFEIIVVNQLWKSIFENIVGSICEIIIESWFVLIIENQRWKLWLHTFVKLKLRTVLKL